MQTKPKGVTTQMKALDEYILLFVLLLKRVSCHLLQIWTEKYNSVRGTFILQSNRPTSYAHQYIYVNIYRLGVGPYREKRAEATSTFKTEGTVFLYTDRPQAGK